MANGIMMPNQQQAINFPVRTNKAQNLTITCDVNANNNLPNNQRVNPPQNYVQNQQQKSTAGTVSNDDSIMALLGVQRSNIHNNDMFPMLRNKFAEFLRTGGEAPKHKPIYDMDIQKSISELQVSFYRIFFLEEQKYISFHF